MLEQAAQDGAHDPLDPRLEILAREDGDVDEQLRQAAVAGRSNAMLAAVATQSSRSGVGAAGLRNDLSDESS